MEKLLHERLREFAKDISFPDNFKSDDYNLLMYSEEAEALADEIERYYIPRPRFEDGEPVEQGDDIGDSSVWFISVFDDEAYHVNLSNGEIIKGEEGEPVKRSQPKVLDADGVEIKVGDTVYALSTGEGLYVEEVFENGQIRDACRILFDSGDITHQEPDSLEKLQRDIANHWSASISAADSMAFHEWADRLSTLIERNA